MPKASSNSEPANTNRFNPYITKGISKTLLTPCRQVGLSRKRKTPNSSDKVSDILKSSSQELAKVAPDTTPLSSKFTSNETSAKSSRSELKKDIKKKSVSKCLITVKENDHNSLEVASLSDQKLTDLSTKSFHKNVDSECDLLKPETKVKSVFNQNDQKISDFETKSDKKSKDNRKNAEDKSKKKKESREKKLESLNKDKLIEKPTILKEINSEITEPIKHSVSEEKVHNYQEKKSSTSVIKEQDDVKINTTKEVPSEKVAEKKTESKKLIKIDPILDHDYTRPEKKTKLKRSLSMKKSTEDLEVSRLPTNSPLKKCSIVLNRIDSGERPEDISEEDIKKLQKQVKEKRQLVDDLIQAEIYKKIHNPDKLNELTAAWKTGCISALNDLLPHLQAHGDIDMATLLNNLRVPEKLIKLSDNGDLI